MILIEGCFCGIWLRKRWEFGDQRRSSMIVISFLLFKIYFIKRQSDFNDFFRGYTNQHFDWHPKVRLARIKAEKKARSYYKKYYYDHTQELIDRCSEYSHENSKLKNDLIALKRTIKIINEEDDP